MRLRSARRHAKPTDYFVEDQQNAVLLGSFGQASQVLTAERRLSPASARGLENHGSDVVARSEEFANRGQVVRWGQQDLSRQFRQYAGARCTVEVRINTKGHVIVPAVEVPGEAHDFRF